MKYDFRYYNFYTADFETSTEKWGEESARVWLWDICTSKYKHFHGTTLNGFMERILKVPLKSLYGFRNLAYDGSYILTWLLSNGYKWKKSDKLNPFEFTTVITDRGSYYTFEICNKNRQHVYIMDTLKTLNMSIKSSAKMFDLPIKKGQIDYDIPRDLNHIPTDEEISYIENDTEIDMRSIQINILNGGVKFTQAGNARYEFKRTMDKWKYEDYFPILPENTDKLLRKAYRGGYVYANPNYCNTIIHGMISLDINSMYPAQMLHKPMPYGEPVYFKGRYENNEEYPLFVQRFSCVFDLKPNHLPTISKRSGFLSSQNLYIESSNNEIYDLTLASPDLELFFKNYNVTIVEWKDGFRFKAISGIEILPETAKGMSKDEIIDTDGMNSIFFEYIRKWRRGKEYDTGAKRDYDKRMQNALYGTFATNPRKNYAVPELNEKGMLALTRKEGEYEPKNGEYIPVAIFVTAWARYFLINEILKHYDKFVYCDTDSLYLLDDVKLSDFNIHPTLYGYFKIEHIIEKFKVVGAKRYLYYGRKPDETENKMFITCCGADEDIKSQMSFDNFNLGATFTGKRTVRQFKGGKQICITTYRLGIKKEGK